MIFSPSKFEGRHPVIGDPGDPDEGVSQSSGGGRRGGNGPPGLGSPGGRRGGGGGGGSRSGRVYKNVDTARPDGFLLYYTGDFGEKAIEYLESRRQDTQAPYYGQVLKDVMEVQDPETEEDSSAARRPQRSGTSTGRNATLAGAGFGRAGGRGGQGNRPPVQRTDTSIIDRATGPSTAEKPEDSLTGSIIPGVELLGRGSKSDLIDRAKAANVDALILFNVKVSKSRGSRNRRSGSSVPTFTNTTNMRIVDIKTAENIYSTKSLKDTDVSEDNDEGDDPINDQVQKAFATADKNFKATELPSSINEKNVKNRIGSLIKNKSGNPLRSAVEVISFYESELLTEELAKTAMKRLFDDDKATVLVDGSESERLNFLRDKLPAAAGE